jgi:hypothetical protein
MRFAFALLAALALTLGASPALADDNVIKLAGHLESHVVPCDSICTSGVLSDGVDGTFDFTLTVLEELGTSALYRYTGDIVIHTANGDLIGQDHAIWNTDTGDLVDHIVITSGTGSYAGYTGSLLVRGNFSLVTGTGASDFLGAIHPSCSH